MEQNIIGLGFDINAFDEQKRHIILSLVEIYEKSKSLSESLIKPGSSGGWTELTAKIKQQEIAISDLQNANLKYAQTLQQVEAGNAKVAASTAAAAKATVQETKSLEQNIDARRKLQNINASYLRDQKEDLALLKSKTISQTEYAKRVNESTIKIESNKAKIAALNKEIRQQISLSNGQVSAYSLLNKEYQLAQENAKNLAVIYGVESAEAKAAAASAAVLDAELKAIDKSVGQSQRNVGNYAEGFGKALGGIWGGIRKIAYILPGLGIAGIFTAGYEALKLVVDELGLFNKKLFDAEAQTKALVELNTKAAESAGKEAGQLQVLRAEVEDINTPMRTRIQIIKDLKEEYPEYFKGLTNEQILAGNVGDAYNRVTDAILRKARAQAASSKIEELSSKQLENDLKLMKDVDETNKKIKEARDRVDVVTGGGVAGTGGVSINVRKQDIQKDLIDAFNARKKANKDEQALLQEQIDFYLKFAKAGADQTVKIDESRAKTKSVAAVKESTKELANAGFEFYKKAAEQRLAIIEDELKREKLTEEEKIQLVKETAEIKIGLINNTLAKELEAENRKLEIQKKNLKNARGTEKNNILVDIHNTNEEIKRLQDAAFLDRMAVDRKLKNDELAIYKETEDEKVRAVQAAEQAIKNVRGQQQSAIDASQAESVAALDVLLKKKVITEKDYAREKAEIDKQTLILTLESQRQELEGLKKIAQIRHEDITEIDNQIRKVQAQIKSAESKTGDVESPENVSGKYDSEISIARSAQQILSSITDAKYQKEIDAIQKVIDKNNEKKEQEVANINASTLSAQEKANQLIILDKTVAANNEKLQRQQRDEKIKQAKFDRDIAILGILENATVAAFKLPAQSGWAGIAAGIALGAEAAAQIAVILSKPLPSYGDGTEYHPGGGAIVGEKKVNGAYQPELVQTPDGKSFITSGPMLINSLPKGSKVKPLSTDQVNQAMYSGMVLSMAHLKDSESTKLDEIKEAIRETGYATTKALRKQKGANVTVHVHTDWGAYINKNVRE